MSAYDFTVPESKLGPLGLAEGDGHQWIVMAVFGASQTTVERILAEQQRGAAETLSLDHENLLTVQGPGCFKCDQQLTAETAATPCPVVVTVVRT